MVIDLLATTADIESMEESLPEELPTNPLEQKSDMPGESEDCCIVQSFGSIDAATQLTATAHEFFPACDRSTQTPIYWKLKGTQTIPLVRSRGKVILFLVIVELT